MKEAVHYTGRVRYTVDLPLRGFNLLAAVPCYVGDLEFQVHALLDTASEWCVLDRDLAQLLGFGLDSDEWDIVMHTRFGLIPGVICRAPIVFRDVDGANTRIEATCFVSPEWPGPTVLGWRGCLERVRFGVDPNEEWCYFGAP